MVHTNTGELFLDTLKQENTKFKQEIMSVLNVIKNKLT